MSVLGGYLLAERLGGGATGTVHRAQSPSGTSVAIKLLHDDGWVAPNAWPALLSLRHPNLMQVHELSLSGSPRYVVLELCEGCDLVSFVRGHSEPAPDEREPSRSLPLAFGQTVQAPGRSRFTSPGPRGYDRLRRSLPQLAGALGELHRNGLVHRDVRADNVLVCAGRVVLIDYDHVCFSGQPVSPSARTACVTSMAPEQVSHDAPHAAWDAYALGVLLFRALTGESPFAGNAQEVLLRKRTVGAPPPSLLLPDVPRELDALCSALLRTDPARRASVGDVAGYLG
ncbi:MAG: serine/threonine protein kinase [Polyangiaceae bacterium]|nr:serine/threonine protein kinase [Polyangiaceae bacterium]